MKRSSRVLMDAIFVLSVLPVSAMAQEKQKGDSAELTAQELEQKACGPRDQQINLSVGHGCNKITLTTENEADTWRIQE